MLCLVAFMPRGRLSGSFLVSDSALWQGERFTMAVHSDIWERLSRSKFRSRFRLGAKERAYADTKGRATIESHAGDFIHKRLAPASPVNDGKQTPMRGHPVFIAQHATATCCRGCLAKWHGIPQGRELNAAEETRVVGIIMCWIDRQMETRADV